MHKLKKEHTEGTQQQKKKKRQKRKKFAFLSCVNYIPKRNRLVHLIISLKRKRFMEHKLVVNLILSENMEKNNNI